MHPLKKRRPVKSPLRWPETVSAPEWQSRMGPPLAGPLFLSAQPGRSARLPGGLRCASSNGAQPLAERTCRSSGDLAFPHLGTAADPPAPRELGSEQVVIRVCRELPVRGPEELIEITPVARHLMRNLLTTVPRGLQSFVATLVRSIFTQPDPESILAQVSSTPQEVPALEPLTSPAKKAG